MLPSKGFFKKNDCPFFEKNLCIRPHCHFRHRKKILNDHLPPTETDAVEKEEEAGKDLLKSIADYKQVSDADKRPCSSTSEVKDTAEELPAHDTLFAKLVNQTNPYEKINRHIPCAYTPTPQTRNVEAKNKSVSAVTGFANSEKSLELITKARTLLQNYCAENIKRYENKSVEESGHKIEDLNQSIERGEQSISKEQILPVGGAEDDKNVIEARKKDNDTPGRSNIFSFTSSEMSNSGGTRVEGSMCSPDDVSEKADCKAMRTCNSGGDEDCSELDFVPSEIEMMKKLLKDDDQGDKCDYVKKGQQGIEEKENKDKSESKEKVKESSHSSSRHTSSSRRKSTSSKTHSSSRSRHSSNHSSRHSRSSSSSSQHHSSSSRHHSSSRNQKSSDHHESSSRHSREHHKSRHGEKSDSESERKKHSISLNDRDSSKRTKSISHTKTSSAEEEEEGDEDEEEDDGMGVEEYFSDETTDEISSTSSRKRKNTTDDEDVLSAKYLSLSNYEDVEDDPDIVEKECLEIFNSYSGNSGSDAPKTAQEITVPNPDYESTVQGKKRTAHASSVMADHSALRYKTVKKPHNIRSAKELMLERYKISEKARDPPPQVPQSNAAPIFGLNRPPVRIAAVSNIQQMLLAKKAIQEKISQGLKVNERTTIAHTIAQGGARVAHVPKVPDGREKPTITEGSKQVPRVKRQSYLEKLLVETNQIFPTKSESAEEALKLEQEIFQLHSGSAAAYHAAFVSLVMKTRRRVASIKGETVNISSSKPKVSHFDILSGGKKNFSVIKTKKMDISMLTEKQIYEELLRCRLTAEELKENGFPIACDRPGYAVCSLNYELKYNEKYQYIKKITGNRRYCIRCSKLYDVNPTTWQQYKEGPETCFYHPGRKKSGGRNCERVYNCCNTSSTEGCMTHVRHVTDSNDYENYPNCVRTLAKEGETDPGVYALDCEMVYTRLGSELARVTVVNLRKEIVYDTLVKPKYPVECYNTFYSGIEEKMMEGVETTLQDVQAVLLSMFSNKTILIGHSLDSDLRALHLIHDTVVDTSVVYKNEKYYPYKYSLKDLCAKKISKIIQDNVNGHDSSEDAIAALEIMLQYVKEEVAKYDSLESYEADRGM